MTKKQRALYANWRNSSVSELWQVYGRYSLEKERAMQYCLDKMDKLGGWAGRICSYNTFQFSFAFLYQMGNKETGEVELWMDYETACNSYQFKVEF